MMREMDFRRDMDGLASLVDVSFTDELAEEGRHIKQDFAYTKRLYPLLWISHHLLAPFSERFGFIFHGYVWEEGGLVVGSVNVNKVGNDAKRWYISNVAVSPLIRRRGIARALVGRAIAFARAHGAEVVTLDVRSNNPAAFGLYESLGFGYLDTSHEMKCERLREGDGPPAFQAMMPADWREHFALARRCASEATQRVMPLREKDYRPSALELFLLRLVDVLMRQETFHLKAVREGRMAAALTLVAKKRNAPHFFSLMAERERQGELADAALRTISSLLRRFPRNNVLTRVDEDDGETLHALDEWGFKRMRTMRKMALTLDEMLLLVDEDDNVTGTETKQRCHDGAGLLHRAFMVAILDSGKILLARRGHAKRLWPDAWDGTVSSHVHEGESYEESARRRAEEELRARCRDIRYLFKFRYQIPYGNHGSEHEICAVLVARLEGEAHPDSEEISEVRWLPWDGFLSDFKKNPESYCPWLALASERMEKDFRYEITRRG